MKITYASFRFLQVKKVSNSNLIGVKLSPLKSCFDDCLVFMMFESLIFDLRVRISIISAKILKILKTHPLPLIHLDKSYTIF